MFKLLLLIFGILVSCSPMAALAQSDAFAMIVVENPILWFSALCIAGALCHYLKQRARNQTGSGFVDYWFADSPGNSLGALGVIAAAIFGAWSTDLLEGMQAAAIISAGWLAGFTANSIANKGAEPAATKEAAL